jgi:hypothetical protein
LKTLGQVLLAFSFDEANCLPSLAILRKLNGSGTCGG